MVRSYSLGFIGGGHMAEGMIAGVIRAGVCPPGKIIVSDISAERRDLLSKKYGVTVTEDNGTVAKRSETVILAIKPQTFGDIAAELGTHIAEDQLIVSIMAGWSTGSLAKALGHATLSIVRVMPNLPIRIGAGMAGICRGGHATDADVALAQRVLDAGGRSLVIENEDLMHAVTALAGSGPAYFYYFTEAIVAGGMAAGLDRDQALTLAKYTCLGAARMLVETDTDPSELRRQVTSPGGTTEAAIASMKWAGVHEAIKQAVLAAVRRGKELGM